MRRKDLKDKDSIRLIVFRNGFVKHCRLEDYDVPVTVKVKFPACRRRKRIWFRKFSFRAPLPGLPF